MSNVHLHEQGNGVEHLTEENHHHATQEATREERGLMPPEVIYEGVWYKPPAIYNSPGLPGMKAFDDDFVYFCVSPNIWRRFALDVWRV